MSGNPKNRKLVKLTSHNATSIHVTSPQVLANRSWKWWLTQQPRWLPEQAGNVDQFEAFKVSTPPKFNIDTKNDGLEIYIYIISFQTWGGKGEKVHEWPTKTNISFLKREAFLFGPWIPMKRCRVKRKGGTPTIDSLKVEPIWFWTSSFAGRVKGCGFFISKTSFCFWDGLVWPEVFFRVSGLHITVWYSALYEWKGGEQTLRRDGNVDIFWPPKKLGDDPN